MLWAVLCLLACYRQFNGPGMARRRIDLSPAIDTKYFPSIHGEKDLMLDYPRPWKGGLSGGRYTCSTSLDSYGLDGCKHH